MTDIQYISDAKGNQVGVIVPIEIWHEIEAEDEVTKQAQIAKSNIQAALFGSNI